MKTFIGGGGGGEGALTPSFGRYVPRLSEKWGALERVENENKGIYRAGSSVQMRGSGAAGARA